MSRLSWRVIARVRISASCSRALFCFICSRSRSPARRNTFFISGFSSSNPFFLSCRRTTSPVKLISPTSKPLTPSTVTWSPFSKCWSVLFLKKSLRLPLLNNTSTTLQAFSVSAKGILDNQSCTFIRLQPPVEHPPLLLQPFGLPVPQLLHPMLCSIYEDQDESLSLHFQAGALYYLMLVTNFTGFNPGPMNK